MTVQQPPEHPKGTELATKVTAGAISSVPLAGGAVAAWFQHYVEAPWEARLADWREDITEVVNELADKYNTLPEDDALLDAIMNATRARQATRQQEKIIALKNGVRNSVAPNAPNADEQARFFRLVDQYSADHLTLLKFLDGPQTFYAEAGQQWPRGLSTLGTLLEAVVPKFAGQSEWYELLFADLGSDRLSVIMSSLNGNMTADGLSQSRTTPLGRRFLNFITDHG